MTHLTSIARLSQASIPAIEVFKGKIVGHEDSIMIPVQAVRQ